MSRGRRLAGLAVLCGLLAGCAGASGGTSTSASPSPSGGASGVVRAALVPTFVCTTADDQGVQASTGPLVSLPASAVQAFLLCPLRLPTGSGKAVLVPRSAPGFPGLLALLSSPDQPRTKQLCPMYADMPQVILARTADGAYVVHIPVDACGHYWHPEVLGRLRQA